MVIFTRRRRPSTLAPGATSRSEAISPGGGEHDALLEILLTQLERKGSRMRTPTKIIRLVAIGALIAVVALPVGAQPSGVDPKAAELLRTSTSYVAGLKRFSVDTRSELEVVLTSGQRIEFGHLARMHIERPNRFRAERVGDLIAQQFIYDGRTLTLHEPAARVFATVAAPPTIETTLEFARSELDIVAPAGDLVYTHAYDILMKDVTSGFIVGEGLVDGVRCVHLAFRAPQTDWQIWLEMGKRPVPRRLVIHSLEVPGAPSFSLTMTKWNVAPTFDASTFRFTPPKDARRVEFIAAVPVNR